MQCPLCPNKLKSYLGNLVTCVRFHRFRVEWAEDGGTKLVLVVDAKERYNHHKGDEFPVPEGETF